MACETMEALCRTVRANARVPLPADDALQPLVEGWLALARRAWPSVELDPACFLEHLAQRLPAQGSLAEVCAADLYFAAACLAGDRRAIDALDQEIKAAAAKAVGRVDPRAEFRDEVCQRVREALLVGDGGAPKLASYSGAGPLGAWVCAVVLGHALNSRRAAERARRWEGAAASPEPADQDPELDYIRQRYRLEFKRAFEEAIAGLSDREKTLLRLNVVERLGIDGIAALYKVHRSSAARWLTSVRQKLLAQARSSLVEQLKVTPSELDSLMRLLRSDLDVSVSRAIGTSRE